MKAIGILGAASIAAMTVPAVAQSASTASDEMAYVVMKSDWWEPAPSMKSTYRLLLSTYDPAAQKLAGDSLDIAAQKKKFVEGYLIQRIKPGHWVFQSYSQQDRWALCFNEHSWQFDVAPGQTVYLGKFDAPRARDKLVSEVIRTGKQRISGYSFADFFDLAEGPAFTPITAADLDTVRDVLQRRAVPAPQLVTAAAYRPARFGTGSTLFAERRCGGYFIKGAKPHTASR